MSCFQVEMCCCCVSLKSGAKIIGFLHTLGALVLAVYAACVAASVRARVGTADDLDGLYTTMFPYACGAAGLGSVHVALGLVLLVGAIKRNTRMLFTWTVLMMTLYVVAIFFFAALTVLNGPYQTNWELFGASVQGALFLSVVGYFIVCVHSHYLNLKSEEDMCGPQDQHCYNQGY